jgi:hypothetical protein
MGRAVNPYDSANRYDCPGEYAAFVCRCCGEALSQCPCAIEYDATISRPVCTSHREEL